MVDRVGQQLGNYRLVRLLGRGGFAEVYLGQHVHLASKQAAIKILQLFDVDARQFQEEAETTEQLVHPHIVRLLDFDIEQGTSFLVLDFAPGGSLRTRHPKGSIVPLASVREYLKELAPALQFAHDKHILHRDMKPDNMLIGRWGELLLSDFGIAVLTQTGRASVSSAYGLAGTAYYMAPETYSGRPVKESDQYALAVVVYEWLCGSVPFSQGDFFQLGFQHVTKPVPPLREKNPTIPPEVETVIMKALAKEPKDRFASVQEFATALEHASQEALSASVQEFATVLEHASQEALSPLFPTALAMKRPVEAEQRQSSQTNAPTGTITFLFTDIEGSTTRWAHHPEAMRAALERHDALLRSVITSHGGYVFKMVGDAVYAAFAVPADAIASAVAAQRAVAAEVWGEVGPLRVRMALHTGAAQSRDNDYFGPTLNRVARLLSTGYGGQILLSFATVELVRDALPAEASLKDLGEHALKDLLRPERIFQLTCPDLPSDFPALKSLTHQVHNLPVQPTPFLGREHEVDSMCDLLRRPEVQLVTLTGPGGIGKTRLSLQVAAEQADQFPDGIFFVALAPVSDAGLVVPTIMQTLSISEAGTQPLLAQLKAALKDKQMLLLLDNFEQVIEAAVQMAELLAACPKLKILVSSRILLHVQAEREFAVSPLSLPNPKSLPDLKTLSQYEAVALFIQRAQGVKADFQVTNTNAPAVAAICVRLDGLPLAIELAAARVKHFPPQMLLKRLEQGLSVLSGGSRDLPARQQTLRNAIAWSYDLLTPEDQQLFRCFAGFVDGCRWEAAEEVCTVAGQWQGDVLEGLVALEDKSLLRQEESTEGEIRFWMLQLLREFGLEELAAKGELQAVREAHARYYLRMVVEAKQHLSDKEEGQLLDLLEQEYDNLRSALTWMLEGMRMERVEMAIQLCEALSIFWQARGQISEGVTFLERIVAEGRDLEAAMRAKALYIAAALAQEQGDFNRLEVHAQASLVLFRELGDNTGSANALIQLAWVAGTRGDGATARKLKEEAVALLGKTSDKTQLADVLLGLADELCAQGEFARGLALFEQSLALYRELGSKKSIAEVLMQSAWWIYNCQGDAAIMRARLAEALPLVREVGDKYNIAIHCWVSALVALGERDLARARALAEESVERFREMERPWYIAWSLIILAQVEAHQGNAAAARNHLEESLELAREMSDKWLIPWGLEGLAGVVAALGEPAWAARLWGAAVALRVNSSFPMPPVERSGYEQAVAAVRSELGEEAFAAAWSQGRTTPLEQVIHDVLKMRGEAGKP